MPDWNRALTDVAARWADSEHPVRVEASAATLDASNSFTGESLAFDVNVAMELLASGRFEAWRSRWGGQGRGGDRLGVAVVATGRTPVEGLLTLAAVGSFGHEALGSASTSSPALAPAFFAEVAAEAGEERVRFVDRRRLFGVADALVGRATPSEREAWEREAAEQGIPTERQHWQPVGWGVAVVDGRESRADLSGLAEDALLHEGGTPDSVRLLWAPGGLQPDPFLDVLAAFREEFPPHPSTDGALKMPAAFLEAAKRPVAVGPGFVVSKGDPEPQDGAHLRWVGYDDLAEPAAWIAAHREQVAFVVAGEGVAEQLRAGGLPEGVPIIGFGDAHRTEPGRTPLTDDLGAFLAGL